MEKRKAGKEVLELVLSILGIIAALVFIYAAWLIIVGGFRPRLNCRARDTQIPSVPVYPNSTPVAEEFVFDAFSFGEYHYTYETRDPLPLVSQYYEEKGRCLRQNDCSGKATPFGTYNVVLRTPGEENNPYITPAPPQPASSVQLEENENPGTRILITISWDRCYPGWMWDEGSVEGQ